MKRIVTLVFLLVRAAAPQPVSAITIPTVLVGDAGNLPDANEIAGENLGAVNYNYNIGKFEVTIGQYTEFLNAVATTDTYDLYNPAMATDVNVAGIARNGSPGSYAYSVIGSPNKPITYVSFGDAARFCNWLQNGQPVGAQGAGTTEDGSYSLNGAIGDFSLVQRSATAKWVIPTANEWWKAGYFEQSDRFGEEGGYWSYPTRAMFSPDSAPPTAASGISNVANIYRNSPPSNDGINDGYAVSGSPTWSATQNYLTDVGAYSAASSWYGTFDQLGNVFEWVDILYLNVPTSPAIPLGGSFTGAEELLLVDPTYEISTVGFRVAFVPEPSSIALATFGLISLTACAWRRRRI